MIAYGILALAALAVGAGLAHAFTNPARSEVEQLRKNRDYWREYGIEAAGQVLEAAHRIEAQRESLTFVMARADELRDALREVAPGHAALGEGELQ